VRGAELYCMPPSFLWEWDARAEQNRGSLAGRSVPATPQPLTRGAGAGQPSRDSLRMSCDCDARGGRETPRQTAVWFRYLNSPLNSTIKRRFLITLKCQ
jgi:hypothetical protein